MTSSKDSLYIKACVIANGIQDQQGDVITKKDIKKIFTNSIDVGFDINHDNIRQDGIYSIEQYISKAEEKIDKHVIPAGSWMAVLRVDNEDIREMIRKHEINGVSITAYPEKGAVIKRSHPKVVLYKDIIEKEKIHPKEISLVKRPSNLLPLEVMEYDTYINKSVQEYNYMNESENETIMKQSTISKLVDVLQQLVSPHVEKAEDDVQATLTVEPENPVEEVPQEPEEEEVETPEENTPEPEETEPSEEPGEETQEEEEPSEEPEEEEDEHVEKMIPQDPQQQQQMGMGGGAAEQALVQIAQICAKALQGQQQQQPGNPQNAIMQSEDPEPEDPIQKEEIPLKDKVTGKMEPTVVSQDYVDRTILFARQTGRDPVTGEKL